MGEFYQNIIIGISKNNKIELNLDTIPLNREIRYQIDILSNNHMVFNAMKSKDT